MDVDINNKSKRKRQIKIEIRWYTLLDRSMYLEFDYMVVGVHKH